MQPQGLHQHHVSEVLCDQKAAGLALALFAILIITGPAKRS
jgi:hypothetical protein